MRICSFLKRCTDDLLHLIAPESCGACGEKLVENEKIICTGCLAALNFNGFVSLKANPMQQELSRLCRGRYEAFSLLNYSKHGTEARVISAFKYKSKQKLAVEMGRIMGKTITQAKRQAEFDVLIPVPLHPKRQRKRGYNQAELLCKGIAEVCGYKLLSDVLVREKHNETQTRKNMTERFSNTKAIFSCKAPEKIKGAKILIVDDVFTTGATLSSCISALYGAGAKSIGVFTLAYARD